MDPQRVYANDNNTNLAFWTVLKGGTHGRIVNALSADSAITTAINAKMLTPADTQAWLHVVDLINRATANCLGQTILGQRLSPDDQSLSLYHVLKGGTAGALDTIINAPENTALHTALEQKDTTKIIQIIARQTGRGLFQACESDFVHLLTNPLDAVNTLKNALKQVLPSAIAEAIP